MKKLALILVCITLSLPTYAGRMKDIYIKAIDSIQEEFGWNLDQEWIQECRFVTVDGADNAVSCKVHAPYKHYTCTVKYEKMEDGYFHAIDTVCKEF